MAKKSKRAWKADRRKVARLQKYEVYFVAHKFGLTPAQVRAIVRRVGNDRRKVYDAARGW